jgi:hypothetical protein
MFRSACSPASRRNRLDQLVLGDDFADVIEQVHQYLQRLALDLDRLAADAQLQRTLVQHHGPEQPAPRAGLRRGRLALRGVRHVLSPRWYGVTLRRSRG